MKKTVLIIFAIVLALAGFAAGSFSGINLYSSEPQTDSGMVQVKGEPAARISDGTVFLYDGDEWNEVGDIKELCENDIFASYIPEVSISEMPGDMRTRTGVPAYVPANTHSYSGGADNPASSGGYQPAPPPSDPTTEWSDDFL